MYLVQRYLTPYGVLGSLYIESPVCNKTVSPNVKPQQHRWSTPGPWIGPIPLNYELPPKARFAHGLVEYRNLPRLTKREMAMLRMMQHITENPGWDQALLGPDETQLTQWRQEAVATEEFLISAPAWDWCIAELRDKAQAWKETGRLLVFDSSSAVCQANVPLLQKDIQTEIGRLGTQASQDSPLVDPSQFPLVYDRSPVLIEGRRVWMTPGF